MSEKRVQLIQERLKTNLQPENLEVIDDSAAHIGHAGSAGGAGHYTVIISKSAFQNQSTLEAHKAVYALLSDLIPDEIHALRIKLV